jgi:hypothetical protein
MKPYLNKNVKQLCGSGAQLAALSDCVDPAIQADFAGGTN